MKIFAPFLFLITALGTALATEEPKYTVVVKTETYEIRKYSAVIVAETKIESDFEEAGSKAFQILADFIFGNNKSKTKISMTAPVSQNAIPEKIAMTAPVIQAPNITGFNVQFTMPQTFTMQTLPIPNDQRIHIREIPERILAVFTYSGTWYEDRYKEKLKEFYSILNTDGVITKGDPIFARYDPPFMPWFLRRNEIWLEYVANKKQ